VTRDSRNSPVQFISKPGPETFAGSSEWYLYASSDHFWFRWRLAALRGLLRRLALPLDDPLRVLDVGCGAGVLVSQLERVTRWIVDGADLNMPALERAPHGRGRYLYYDVTEEDEERIGTYDVVTLFDVLEHIHETQPFLAAVARHLRPGGILLLNVPALQRFHSPYDEAVGHLRRYDRRSLAGEIEEADLEIVEQRYWGFSMLPLLALRAVRLRLSSTGPVIRRGIEPPAGWLHGVLSAIGELETTIWKRPWLGTSLLLAARGGK
jgi:SAM-dependent methyltransferase